jgi:hypothetical protein
LPSRIGRNSCLPAAKTAANENALQSMVRK